MKKLSFSGSYTVELALLLPIILLAIVGSIYMVLHFHNSASLAVGAAEIAVSGKEDTQLPPLLFTGPITPQVSANAERRSVRFDAATFWYTGRSWQMSRSAVYEGVRPVTNMNRVRALQKAGKALSGNT